MNNTSVNLQLYCYVYLERIKSKILYQPEERTPLLTDIPEEGDEEGTQIVFNTLFQLLKRYLTAQENP